LNQHVRITNRLIVTGGSPSSLFLIQCVLTLFRISYNCVNFPLFSSSPINIQEEELRMLNYKFIDMVFIRLVEQREIAKEKKPGAPLDWSDTRRMKYTWQVVQETLRLQPPVIASFREALQDFQYAGYSILKGWKVS